MKTHTITTYSFEELSEEAQEKALIQCQNWNVEGFKWWDAVYEDAKEVGKLLGITIDKIYFSGFPSQGDGACFAGQYEYAKGSCRAIREYAPRDTELHRIADELRKLQRRYFYGLYAYVTYSGHYMRKYCSNIDVRENDMSCDIPADEIAELLRDFMEWIYRAAEREYDYLISDEVVKESLIANEVEFLESGARYI